MHRVSISKNSNRLNKVSCLCGMSKSFTTGLGAEYEAGVHSRGNGNAEVVTFNDGIQQPRDIRRAKPGRNPGGVNHGANSEDNR